MTVSDRIEALSVELHRNWRPPAPFAGYDQAEKQDSIGLVKNERRRRARPLCTSSISTAEADDEPIAPVKSTLPEIVIPCCG